MLFANVRVLNLVRVWRAPESHAEVIPYGKHFTDLSAHKPWNCAIIKPRVGRNTSPDSLLSADSGVQAKFKKVPAPKWLLYSGSHWNKSLQTSLLLKKKKKKKKLFFWLQSSSTFSHHIMGDYFPVSAQHRVFYPLYISTKQNSYY